MARPLNDSPDPLRNWAKHARCDARLQQGRSDAADGGGLRDTDARWRRPDRGGPPPGEREGGLNGTPRDEVWRHGADLGSAQIVPGRFDDSSVLGSGYDIAKVRVTLQER